MKNKAFTLIELLAVIIILGILAVLIIPKVVNTLNESEKNTNMTSAQNIVKTAELKTSNNNMVDNNKDIKINYTTGENINYLDYSGEKPQKGYVQIKANGEVAMAVKIGDYCFIKKFSSNEIISTSYNEQVCEEAFINFTIPELSITGDGLYEALGEPGRYVYRGENPNNYINIKEDGANNTLYRIVSYEPDGTIKVVRDEKLSTNMVWDEHSVRESDGINNTYCTSGNGCNVWGNGYNTLHNGLSLDNYFHFIYYSNSNDTTFSNGHSGKVGTDSTLNKYLNDGNWTDIFNIESYIDNHFWNVGGVYLYTTNGKGIEKEKEEERQLKWNGKIGLMNITEYAEASLNPACTSTISNYGPASGYPCKELNWAHKSYDQWTISSASHSSVSVWFVTSEGYFNYADTYTTFGVRPALYLKSTTILGGIGTSENPYYIIES